jgi:hypothetical protein
MDPPYSVSKILLIWTPHVKNEGKSIFPITIHYVNIYPRNGNSVAHLLARHAKELSSRSYWIEEAPSFLFSALASDVLLSNSE